MSWGREKEMPTRTRALYGIIVVLVALFVIASSVAGLYYLQYSRASYENSAYAQELKALGAENTPRILFDYGNGTKAWYNSTRFQPGTNLYVATQVLAGGEVNATYYPQYSEHFVTSIFDVANSGDRYWGIWTYNSTASWQSASVGPDDLPILNDSVYAWVYCSSNCTAP
jgi:hypothetical protein